MTTTPMIVMVATEALVACLHGRSQPLGPSGAVVAGGSASQEAVRLLLAARANAGASRTFDFVADIEGVGREIYRA